MGFTIWMVFEKSDNPHYNNSICDDENPLTELVKPDEISGLIYALIELGYRVEEIDGPFGFLEKINQTRDQRIMVFNKCRGFKGLERKVFVPSLCQLYNVPMVGSSAYTVTLARHKFHSNRLIRGLGYKSPGAVICYSGELPDLQALVFPVIIKPNHESGALGIDARSVQYYSEAAVEIILDLQRRFDQPVIVEEFIEGEEWKVAVIGNQSGTFAAGCVGVAKNGRPITGSFQTRQDLLLHQIKYYRPESCSLKTKAMELAVKFHNYFGCKDYSRCDFRINGNCELVFMEMSTHPDIGRDSSFINAALQKFKNYEEIIESILNAASLRYGTMKE